MILMTINSSFSIVHGLGEGLMLIFGLFPGFFSIVIIIGVLLSWVSPDPYNPVVQTILSISEPLLDPFRRFVPNLGGLDISPILALICFRVIGKFGQRLVAGILAAI
jgi:YggT family protein